MITIHRTPAMLKLLLMPVCLVWLLAACTTIHPVGPQKSADVVDQAFSHTEFDVTLAAVVDDRGRVDYRALQKNPQHLDTYYRQIATFSPDSHPRLFPGKNHQLAYWINAYNSAAIQTVLTHYPIRSVLDVKTPALFFFLGDKAGFFFFQRVTFGGKTTSLYYLENKVIRKRFDDPRVHFALNCASASCPRLPRRSFSGNDLDAQLDREARRFIAEPRNFRIDHDAQAVYLSSIFKWYEKDFIDSHRRNHPDEDATLLAYISRYLTDNAADALKNVAASYTIRFTPYDWRLNDQNDPAATFPGKPPAAG